MTPEEGGVLYKVLSQMGIDNASQLAQYGSTVQKFAETNWKELLIGGVSVYFLYNRTKAYLQKRRNMQKITVKRAKIEEKKRQLKRILTDNSTGEMMTLERETILALHINELLLKLRSGDLDPLAVLEAFQARALEATDSTNCVVDFLLEARHVAMDLRNLSEHDRGPLHGLPISVKECYYVKGYDATVGLIRYLNCPAQEDAAMVKRMRQLGAVPFCLTNVPQTMKTYACSNPVYGVTTHPLDKTRTPGGSSGGEGALIAMGGSPLGLGSDVGGSLRIPAHFCGISSLKPTTGRIFERGRRKGTKGIVVGVQSNSGFMSKSVDGVILGMKTFLQDPMKMAEMDHKVVPLPWQEKLFSPSKRLKIGWYDDDGYFKLTPCCKRAVRVAVDTLEKLGCEVVYFRPPQLENIAHYFFDHILADAGINNLELWEGEILDQAVEINSFVYKTPMWIKRWMFAPIFYFLSRIMYQVSTRGHTKSKDLWKSLERLDDMVEKMLQDWNDLGLDCVIAPGFAYPAPPITNPARLVPAVSYTAAYNVVDFPAGSVPISRVNQDDQEALEDYPRNDLLYHLVYNGTKGAVGMPLNVQVIGRPWQEEMVLHVMKLLQDKVNFV